MLVVTVFGDSLRHRSPDSKVHGANISAGATQSEKYVKFNSIVFQFCIRIVSCFFDLLPGELHQEARALTINSDNHLQSADYFVNLRQRPNIKCIRKR